MRLFAAVAKSVTTAVSGLALMFHIVLWAMIVIFTMVPVSAQMVLVSTLLPAGMFAYRNLAELLSVMMLRSALARVLTAAH